MKWLNRDGWIGVDMGARTLKLAQMEMRHGKLHLSRGVVIPRTAEISRSEDDGKTAPHWSDMALRGALAMEGGFLGRRVACVLPSSETNLRPMRLPPATEAEQRAIIAQELTTVFGTAADKFVFDFWPTTHSTREVTGDENEAYVLSTSSQATTATLETLSRAGLRCEVLDGHPWTAARAANLAEQERSRQPVGVLDWGYQGANLCVVLGGRPAFSRYLTECGLREFVEAVRKALDISLEESERLLCTEGFPTREAGIDSQNVAQEVIADTGELLLKGFAAQLRETVSYLSTGKQHLLPRRIWIIGGGANIKNAPAVLSAELGIELKPWRFSEYDENRPMNSHASREPLLAEAMTLSALRWAS